MKDFRYVAKSADGKKTKGVISALNKLEANNDLRKKGLTILSLDEGGQKRSWVENVNNLIPVARKISTDDLVILTRQLSTMISAGIPLLECLEVLQEQSDKPGMKLVLREVIDKVRAGSDFSEAIAAFPKAFSRIYVNLIKAGEASGQLDIILLRLAGFLESNQMLKREIRSALTYPVVSLTLIFSIVGFLMLFIIPRFEAIFSGLGVPLPVPTLILMKTSRGMVAYWYIWIPGLAAIIIGFIGFLKTRIGEYWWDWTTLRLPVFGNLFRKVAISRFTVTLATLIKSGVPILGALEIVASTAGNRLIEDAVNAARENVRKGETLSEPLARSKLFPPMVTRMIGIGEKSGALDALLEKIAEFYDGQVKATVKALTSLIEPVMIGIMGVIVGSIVVSMMLPIFALQKALGKH